MVNSLNKRRRSKNTPRVVREVTLHDLKVGALHAINSLRIIELVFISQNKKQFPTLFEIDSVTVPDQLTAEDKLYSEFMQDNSMSHTQNNSVGT
jgi:hypothetical protein